MQCPHSNSTLIPQRSKTVLALFQPPRRAAARHFLVRSGAGPRTGRRAHCPRQRPHVKGVLRAPYGPFTLSLCLSPYACALWKCCHTEEPTTSKDLSFFHLEWFRGLCRSLPTGSFDCKGSPNTYSRHFAPRATQNIILSPSLQRVCHRHASPLPLPKRMHKSLSVAALPLRAAKVICYRDQNLGDCRRACAITVAKLVLLAWCRISSHLMWTKPLRMLESAHCSRSPLEW